MQTFDDLYQKDFVLDPNESRYGQNVKSFMFYEHIACFGKSNLLNKQFTHIEKHIFFTTVDLTIIV